MGLRSQTTVIITNDWRSPGNTNPVRIGLKSLMFLAFVDHRHTSLHIHHPLSKHLPEGRRKKPGRKRKDSGRTRSSSMGSAPPIDEDEEDEELDEDSCSQQDKEGNVTTTPTPETDTEVDAQVKTHTHTHTHTLLVMILHNFSLVGPQFFVSEDDPDSTVKKNDKASPQRKLPIIPHSMLHTSSSIPENFTTTAYVDMRTHTYTNT